MTKTHTTSGCKSQPLHINKRKLFLLLLSYPGLALCLLLLCIPTDYDAFAVSVRMSAGVHCLLWNQRSFAANVYNHSKEIQFWIVGSLGHSHLAVITFKFRKSISVSIWKLYTLWKLQLNFPFQFLVSNVFEHWKWSIIFTRWQELGLAATSELFSIVVDCRLAIMIIFPVYPLLHAGQWFGYTQMYTLN